MKVDINLIKELRGLTHAPMGDCKKALEATDGDVSAAKEWLKERGIAKAAKKWDRVTSEWVVKFVSDDGIVYGIKVLCETDFVAKNEAFLSLVDQVLVKIKELSSDVSSIDELAEEDKSMLQSMLDENVAKIGESLRLAAVYKKSQQGYVYNHNGKVSAIIFYEGDDQDAAKTVALQLAAMNPEYLSVEWVPQSRKDELVDSIKEELKDSNKPDDIKGKIIEWRLRKIREEEVLLEQISIKDDSKKVKELASGIVVQDMLRVTI